MPLTKTKKGASYAGVILIGVIFVAMLAFVMTLPLETRESAIPTLAERPALSTLLDVGPSTIIYTGPVSFGLEKSTWNLGEMELYNLPAQNSELIATQFFASKGTFSSKPTKFNFIISDKESIDSVFFQTFVSSVSGDGATIIKLNDQLLFSGHARNALDIELPLNWLNEGANILEVGVTSPGVFFWVRNEYFFGRTYLTTNRYIGDVGRITKTLSIPREKADYIETAKLTFFISRVDQKDLTVKLNDFVLYSSPPNEWMELYLPIGLITTGVNVFEFSAERGASYDISFITLETESLPIGFSEQSKASYTFNVNEEDWKRIKSNTVVCDLRIYKNAGARAVKINLNSRESTISFSNNLARLDVCNSLVLGTNRLYVTASESLDIKGIELKLRR